MLCVTMSAQRDAHAKGSLLSVVVPCTTCHVVRWMPSVYIGSPCCTPCANGHAMRCLLQRACYALPVGQPEEMRTLRLKRHTLSVSMYIKLNYRHSLLGLACEYNPSRRGVACKTFGVMPRASSMCWMFVSQVRGGFEWCREAHGNPGYPRTAACGHTSRCALCCAYHAMRTPTHTVHSTAHAL